jgi:hypothetical protein
MAMRLFLPRILVAAALLMVAPAPRAKADWGLTRYETVYVAPSTSILTVPTAYFEPTYYVEPTSYVVPTTYVEPTSYVVPTGYTSYSYVTPTAYVQPTTYYLSPTAYVVPSLYTTSRVYAPRRWFRRWFYPRTYTYYYPPVVATSLSYPVVATTYPASDCAPSPAPPAYSGSATPVNPGYAPPASNGQSRRPQRPIQSEAAASEPALRETTPPVATPGSLANPGPPATPAPEPNTETVPPGPGATGGGAAQPQPANPAPGGQATTPGSAGALETLRQSQKPVPTDLDIRRVSATRGVLEGKVVSAESQQPQSGVRVFVSDHRRRFDDRVATSDADGRFSLVNLPEGDWTVSVEMPSRKVYAVSEITFASGRLTDSFGRDVPGLIIQR